MNIAIIRLHVLTSETLGLVGRMTKRHGIVSEKLQIYALVKASYRVLVILVRFSHGEPVRDKRS